MKKYFTILSLCLTLLANSQTQYVYNFTTVSNLSDFGFGSQGFMTDFSSPRRCVFDDYYPFNQYGSYSRQLYDPLAQNYAQSWDSIIYKFKYKTTGFAKNFNIKLESPSQTNLLFSSTKNYNQPDSAYVRVKLSLFFTYYSANCKIWLIKQDTTLNNFTVTLSDMDIKGYLHYGTVGVNEVSKSDNKIYWNDKTIYFDEKWLNKKYWINDIYGKVIYSGIVNSQQEQLNLESGLYILNTEQSSQKMIISSY